MNTEKHTLVFEGHRPKGFGCVVPSLISSSLLARARANYFVMECGDLCVCELEKKSRKIRKKKPEKKSIRNATTPKQKKTNEIYQNRRKQQKTENNRRKQTTKRNFLETPGKFLFVVSVLVFFVLLSWVLLPYLVLSCDCLFVCLSVCCLFVFLTLNET